jgi:hypothetical protein
MEYLITGVYGLSYMAFMFGFLVLYRKLRKQPVSYRSIFNQAVLGGVVFMLLLTFLGATQ